jgi:hypothetical protein
VVSNRSRRRPTPGGRRAPGGGLQPHVWWAPAAVSALVRGGLQAAGSAHVRGSRQWALAAGSRRQAWCSRAVPGDGLDVVGSSSGLDSCA